jgi:hypothetical protein
LEAAMRAKISGTAWTMEKPSWYHRPPYTSELHWTELVSGHDFSRADDNAGTEGL